MDDIAVCLFKQPRGTADKFSKFGETGPVMRRPKKDDAACEIGDVLEMLFRSLSCCYERLARS